LVKIFSRLPLQLDLPRFHSSLMKVFDVPSEALQVICVPNVQMYPNPSMVYVSIRAKSKASRTPQLMEGMLKETASLLKIQGIQEDVRVRCELYDPSLQSAGFLQGKM